MPIIKTDKYRVIAGEPIASQVRNNAAPLFAALSPSEDAFYFMGKAYDPQTFSYMETVQSPALADTSVNDFLPENNSIVTAKPYATSALANPAVNVGYAVTQGWTTCKSTYANCLDNDARHNQGLLLPFEDGAGVKHFFYCTQFTGAQGATVEAAPAAPASSTTFSKITLVQGDSLQSSVVARRQNATANYGNISSTTFIGYEFRPVFVDTATKSLFGVGYVAYSVATTTSTWNADVWLVPLRVPYTTNAVDGSLTIGAPVVLSTIGRAGDYRAGMGGGGVQAWYFLGLADNGETLWLSALENDGIGPGNPWASSGYDANWANGTYWEKTTYRHRITIYSYNVGSNTATIVYGPLGGVTGWVSGGAADSRGNNFSHFAQPSAFVPSPKAGETNVFYSYHLLVNTSDVPSFIAVRWDKGADTFTVVPCSINMGGLDISTVYQHPAARNNVFLMVAPKVEATIKADGSLYVSVFNEHKWTANISATTTANNLITFSVSSADPTALTYFNFLAGLDALESFAHDGNCRQLNVLARGAVKVLTFGAGGFSVSSSTAGDFLGLSRDSLGNVWGVSVGDTNLYAPSFGSVSPVVTNTENYIPANLELITSGNTNNVSCVFADTAISYAGTTLNKNLLVNAYDESGARIASTVILKLTSSVATFTSNGGTTLTISTSAATDTTVGLTITGSGLINVSASFTI